MGTWSDDCDFLSCGGVVKRLRRTRERYTPDENIVYDGSVSGLSWSQELEVKTNRDCDADVFVSAEIIKVK